MTTTIHHSLMWSINVNDTVRWGNHWILNTSDVTDAINLHGWVPNIAISLFGQWCHQMPNLSVQLSSSVGGQCKGSQHINVFFFLLSISGKHSSWVILELERWIFILINYLLKKRMCAYLQLTFFCQWVGVVCTFYPVTYSRRKAG